jgi:hypothetical protein
MRLLLTSLGSLACLSFALSGLRVGGIQVFDLLAAVTILLVACARPKAMAAVVARSADLAAYTALMLLAVLASALSTPDLAGHLDRSLRIVVQTVLVWTFVRVATEAIGLSPARLLGLALVSCLVCCVGVIVEGVLAADAALVRSTGLAEHPIEAGYIAAFGVLIGVDAALRRRLTPFLLAAALACGYSLRYSVSLSALGGLGAGLLVLLLLHRRYLSLAATALCIVLWLSYEANTNSLLFGRLHAAIAAGGDYVTVASRLAQNGLALSLLADGSFLFGRGYALSALPYGQEVHNTLLAAVFHFGLPGLFATLILWRKLVVAALQRGGAGYHPLMVALLVLFLAISLTGPALARRSLWFPLVVVGLAQLRRDPAGQGPRAPTRPVGQPLAWRTSG